MTAFQSFCDLIGLKDPRGQAVLKQWLQYTASDPQAPIMGEVIRPVLVISGPTTWMIVYAMEYIQSLFDQRPSFIPRSASGGILKQYARITNDNKITGIYTVSWPTDELSKYVLDSISGKTASKSAFVVGGLNHNLIGYGARISLEAVTADREAIRAAVIGHEASCTKDYYRQKFEALKSGIVSELRL